MLTFDDPHRTLALWLDGERLDHAVADAARGPTLVHGEGPLADVVLIAAGERHELSEATAVSIGGRVMGGDPELRATILADDRLLHGVLERARGRGCQVVLACFRTARDSDATDDASAPTPAMSTLSEPTSTAPDLGWAAVAAASAEAAQQAAVEEAERAAIEAARERAQKEAARGSTAPSRGLKRKRIKRIADQKSSVPLPKAAPLPKASSRRDDFVHEPIPEEGDWVHHRQFGVCEVLSMDDDGGMTLRLANGRKRRVILDVFRVLEPRIEDDKIIYPLQPRRR